MGGTDGGGSRRNRRPGGGAERRCSEGEQPGARRPDPGTGLDQALSQPGEDAPCAPDPGAGGEGAPARPKAGPGMNRLALVAVLALGAGCAGAPARDSAYCAQLFDQLDTFERLVVVPRPGPGPGAVDFRQQQLARIRQAQCLTLTRDLQGMEALSGQREPAPATGAPFRRPVAVQAGVVTNMEDDARARAFFEGHGYRARSVGSPGLGRRIYVQATSPQALGEILDLARRAGFIGPYPSRYAVF